MPSPEKNQRYTYDDYCTWDDDKRWELYEGVAYLMFGDESCVRSPAPAWPHQRAGGKLHHRLAGFLEGKPLEVFYAPFDVRLNPETGDDTVFQPDLVICDPAILSKTGCKGAPDFVVEILSPSTRSRDRVQKFNAYLQAGVREYWIVDTDNQTIMVNLLENGKYVSSTYGAGDIVPVHLLDGCEIALSDLFA